MILSVDPGVSNGIAVFNPFERSYLTMVTKQHKELYDFFKLDTAPGITQVVIENFAAQRISGYGLHTVRVVGAVEALCHVHDIPLAIRAPQQRRGFIDFAKIIIDKQESGWVIHQADALAHLLAWQYQQELLGINNDGLYFRNTDPRVFVVDRRNK